MLVLSKLTEEEKILLLKEIERTKNEILIVISIAVSIFILIILFATVIHPLYERVKFSKRIKK